ncbi:MAG: hypothetical protein KIT58_19035, partial [Planctomycetota bacterium]|nr:hypothetical protein [Planctomycetota bacterium]
ELRGEGLTLPVELLPGERLVVVAAPTRLEVSRLCPLSLETQLLMITPRHAWTVAARLPGDDPAWLPVRGAPPHVIDLDPAVDAPRLRVRPAFARELRLLRDWPRAPGELEPDGTRDCLHEWKTRR